MKLIKSISGIRGIVGETLTTSTVNYYTNIFTHIQTKGDILLARDSRYHGEDIEANFSIREASLLFLETHDIQDVAEMLTKIPKKINQQLRGSR